MTKRKQLVNATCQVHIPAFLCQLFLRFPVFLPRQSERARAKESEGAREREGKRAREIGREGGTEGERTVG